MSDGRSRSGGIVDVEDPEAVEQVLAKVAALDGFAQVAVGGGDDPDVRLQEARPAEPLELALLQHPQELRLRGQAHLADLVEEQHAARRELHLTGLGLLRARERAALVAEQLRLEQLLGQAAQFRATNGRFLRADAAWMNRATTSLPVPDSPVTSTVVSVEATCVALRSTPRHSTDSPTTRRWAPASRRSTPRCTPASTRCARSSSM